MMNKLYGELRGWGCDVDGALERVINDDELYLACLQSIAHDETFFSLETRCAPATMRGPSTAPIR